LPRAEKQRREGGEIKRTQRGSTGGPGKGKTQSQQEMSVRLQTNQQHGKKSRRQKGAWTRGPASKTFFKGGGGGKRPKNQGKGLTRPPAQRGKNMGPSQGGGSGLGNCSGGTRTSTQNGWVPRQKKNTGNAGRGQSGGRGEGDKNAGPSKSHQQNGVNVLGKRPLGQSGRRKRGRKAEGGSTGGGPSQTTGQSKAAAMASFRTDR